jgi:hypothetical protein
MNQMTASINVINLDTHSLAVGVYVVQVITTSETKSIELLKL